MASCIRLQFTLGENLKTRAPQWKARVEGEGATTVYVPFTGGPKPTSPDEVWLCELQGRDIFVSEDGAFSITAVRLVSVVNGRCLRRRERRAEPQTAEAAAR